tara:strand:+ start:6334 stop:9222 length:2889 start_codon:yes stop_codon:yes gene_type:complete
VEEYLQSEFEFQASKYGEYQEAVFHGVPLDLIEMTMAAEGMQAAVRIMIATKTYTDVRGPRQLTNDDMNEIQETLDENVGELKSHVHALSTFLQRSDTPAAGDVQAMNAYFAGVEEAERRAAAEAARAEQMRAGGVHPVDPLSPFPSVAPVKATAAAAPSSDTLAPQSADTGLPLLLPMLWAGIGMAHKAAAAWNFVTSFAKPGTVMEELDEELRDLSDEFASMPTLDELLVNSWYGTGDEDEGGMDPMWWFFSRYVGIKKLKTRQSFKTYLLAFGITSISSMVMTSIGFGYVTAMITSMVASTVVKYIANYSRTDTLEKVLTEGLTADKAREAKLNFRGALFRQAENIHEPGRPRTEFHTRVLEWLRLQDKGNPPPNTEATAARVALFERQKDAWFQGAFVDPDLIHTEVSQDVRRIVENHPDRLEAAMAEALEQTIPGQAGADAVALEAVGKAILSNRGLLSPEKLSSVEAVEAVKEEIRKRLDPTHAAYDKAFADKVRGMDRMGQAEIVKFLGHEANVPLSEMVTYYLKTALTWLGTIGAVWGMKRVHDTKRKVNYKTVGLIHQYITGALVQGADGVLRPDSADSVLNLQVKNATRVAAYTSEFAWYAMQKIGPTKLVEIYDEVVTDNDDNQVGVLKRRRPGGMLLAPAPAPPGQAPRSVFAADVESRKETSKCFCDTKAYLDDIHRTVYIEAGYTPPVDEETNLINMSELQRRVTVAYKGKAVGKVAPNGMVLRTLSVMDLKGAETELRSYLTNNYRVAMTIVKDRRGKVTQIDPAGTNTSNLDPTGKTTLYLGRLNEPMFTRSRLTMKQALGLDPELNAGKRHFIFVKPEASGLTHPEDDGVAGASAWHHLWNFRRMNGKFGDDMAPDAQDQSISVVDAKMRDDGWCNPGPAGAMRGQQRVPRQPAPAPLARPQALVERRSIRKAGRVTRAPAGASEVLPRPVSVVDELFAKHQIRS